MSGQVVVYVRVSSDTQSTARQDQALSSVKAHKVFTDKASGKDLERPALKRALNHLREGDTLVVYSMDRLSRSLADLSQLVASLTAQGVEVRFLKEGLTFTSEDNAMSNLLLGVMGAFAQFERSVIRERQLQGISIAKAEGRYKGRKASLSEAQVGELNKMVSEGTSKADAARHFGITRQTVYAYLQKN